MSDEGNGNRAGQDPEAPGEVLSNLPRRRPQRSSARREAARSSRATGNAGPPKRSSGVAPNARPKREARQGPDRASTRKSPREDKERTSARQRTPAGRSPAQGFEPELGRSLNPPSGTEMLGAVVDAAGELAQTGLSLGGRVVRGVISRIPGR